jgi:hypothetical protein
VLDNLSDDWEFRETEILKNKDEVRSLRARLSVLEGKMALQIMYGFFVPNSNIKIFYFSIDTIMQTTHTSHLHYKEN